MAQAPLQPARGTHDLIGAEFRRHHHVIEVARRIAALYGFEEWATPIFEDTRVFARGLGDTSDVVSKEMYSFADRGGESITLRPENTAGVCRALVSNGLTQSNLPRKVFYAGPMFRYERPQKGRYRQFHQIGIEVLGAAEPLADAEVIACGWHIQQELGIDEGTVLEINTLGDAASREAYRAALIAYFAAHRDALSEDSRTRLEKNPLRILDSKDPKDKALVAGAPTIHDHLTAEAAGFYAAVKRHLDAFEVPFRENPRIVRGLDYYSHTAFEFVTDRLGAQGTVMGGGRYNGLVEEMGGPPTPSVGWAAGVERLSLLLEAAGLTPAAPRPVAIIPIGEAAEPAAIDVLQSLRDYGVVAEIAYRGNMKRRLERANRIGAGAAVILGEEELAAGMAVVRNLDAGSQERVALPDLLRALAETGVVESAAQAMLNSILEEELGDDPEDTDADTDEDGDEGRA
ncbi:histidine--tRNA ligase [Roseicella sp. DB1501]|uniref:histidine--tRNA ligase n=1 Tax=Roseicella sp. DB1501 TaxID=2730925 RepID=UPI0014915B78|nr:histidine--tRNA ligase [Roseicella sp. DB1501]NOG73775.1 histidine--tRNA ligase [Roseicella sp. DB1501]